MGKGFVNKQNDMFERTLEGWSRVGCSFSFAFKCKLVFQAVEEDQGREERMREGKEGRRYVECDLYKNTRQGRLGADAALI